MATGPCLVKNERSFYICRMPRVSEAHLAARRQQILDAARTCFTRNGFHVTSMHDVIAEAGLSVGAVYRYFKSKNEIVEAIAEEYLSQVTEMIDSVAADPDQSIVDVMRAAITFLDANTGPDGAMRLAVQVWGEAVRDEQALVPARKMYRRVRGTFVHVAERAIGSGELPSGGDPEAIGAGLFSLLVGYGLQKLLTGGPPLEVYLSGLTTLLGGSALAQPAETPSGRGG
jgi:AcrR family transcriptional regulator